MQTKLNLGLIVFFLLTTILGCSSPLESIPNNIEENFLAIVPVSNMNDNLLIEVEGNQEQFQPGSEIRILIYNNSSQSIFLAEDPFLKIFTIKEGDWVEVKDEITRFGSQVLSPKGTILLDQSYTRAKPALTRGEMNSNLKDLPVRIVVVGEIMENDVRTGELVGAYVDVYIEQ